MSNQAPAPGPTPQRSTSWRRAARWVLLGGALLGAAIGALVTTPRGLETLVWLVDRMAPIHLVATGAQGALTRDFGFDRLRVEAGGTAVDIVDLRARLAGVSLRTLRVDFVSLSARQVDVTVAPSGKPAAPPESIASPVAVSAGRLSVGEIKLDMGAVKLSARALDAAVALGPDGYEVAKGHIEVAGQPMTLEGRLGGRNPFALAVQGEASTSLQSQPVRVQWRADGSLLDFALVAELAGGQARGTASARIGSFDQPPLKSLHADIQAIDLSAWRQGLPSTKLQIRADLQPQATMERLAGRMHIVNSDAGRIDAGKVPVREVRADVVLTRDTLSASALAVELPRGRVSGTVTAQFGEAARWQAELRLDGVDPATVHSRARPLQLDGKVRAQHEAGVSIAHAELRSRGPALLSAVVDLRMTPDRVDIERATLALGAGRAAVTGTLGLTGDQRLSAKGTVARFDPGLLAKGIDARISGEFDADAHLQPQPHGQLRFELHDSLAFGRPLTGHGRVQLDAAQQLAVDVRLDVRSAHFSAQGGLGAGGRSLAIAVDAPALDELVPQVRGALKADVTVSGAWRAPAIEARVMASDLRLAEHSLKQLQAAASYSGGTDGLISLHAEATNHGFRDNPALSVRAATLAVEGRLSEHAVTLRGTMANEQEMSLSAQGGWRQSAWRGVLREASAGKPLEARLAAPSAVVIGPAGIEFGPAQLDLAGARIEELVLAADSAGLRTSGRFSGLRPQALVRRGAVDGDGATGGARSRPDWLALRGEWRLQLGAQADGMLRIERSGGDLYARGSVDSALQMRGLRIEANLNASHLEAVALADSANGSVKAQLTASVEHSEVSGWRLAQTRPWQVTARADLPKLALLSAMLSEGLRANLRLDGSLAGEVTVDGTPSEPQARGTLTGDHLRAAWVEQGMRLENGRLRARLVGDVLQLDELSFAGPPRVRPKDPRAAAKVNFNEEGSVLASGQIRVRDLEGVIRVKARRLPVLQRPDRWVIASGDLKAETSLQRLQLTGDFTALAGYVESVPAGLPSLSTDVVVTRAGSESGPAPSRFVLGFDVAFNLGDSFYVHGLGVDARAEGTVRLRSAGRGAVTASGAIEAKDGRYDGLGQKLDITRGRLNFQGPPENPAIDVLAIKRGLPVEVGVSITHTVKDPLVRLYSDPAMGDAEIMSWLVLGHPGDQSQADNLALLQTAQGLLSRKHDGGVTGQVAKTLGMDDISLRSGDLRSAGSLLPKTGVAGDLHGDDATRPTATTQILSVSKRIGDAITLGYEQALTGSENVLQLSYRISQRLRLVARAGTENAIDLVYSFAFD